MRIAVLQARRALDVPVVITEAAHDEALTPRTVAGQHLPVHRSPRRSVRRSALPQEVV